IECEYCRAATKLAVRCENYGAPAPSKVVNRFMEPPILYNTDYIKAGTFSNKPREIYPVVGIEDMPEAEAQMNKMAVRITEDASYRSRPPLISELWRNSR